MQNPQMAMAGMTGGPVEGTPIMGNMARPGMNPRDSINTYIYDYFLRNNHRGLARAMIEADVQMNLKAHPKQSPSGRNVNGVDSIDDKDDLPLPILPTNQLVENSFLMDWWCQFWDVFSAKIGKSTNPRSAQYSQQAKNLAQLQNDQRNQRLSMGPNSLTPQQFQMMQGMQRNGADPKAMQRAAIMNRNPNGVNPMTNMNQLKNPGMMPAQMQRDGSGMNMNGQQPQSPNSADNAPSPNKRPRVEGGMNAGNMPGGQFGEFAQQAQNVPKNQLEVYAQNMAQQQRIALNNHALVQAMNGGVQGSPMTLEGQGDLFAGNPSRPGGMPGPGGPGQPGGNHALQDYQMQLMLLEQQNKKRLLMARQEQDSMSGGPHNQPNVGGPGFPPAMSPQGSRAGPSPNPNDQMKRGTPKLPQQGPPGSPMPDLQQQRNSPAPNINFDPSQLPPGMPPQYPGFGQMPQNPQMMRPPSSHPGNFNGQLTPQQMEAMRQNGGIPNGWRGPGNPQAIMQAQQQIAGPISNPQQRGQMPPPPAPPAGEQPRAQEPSPQQPAAPPTPQTQNKANPKKKATKDNNKKPKAKGANTGATPAASAEEPPPTPATPITPMHKASFTNGQPAQPAQQPPAAVPQPSATDNIPPFGNDLGNPSDIDPFLDGFGGDALETFDFDSFLHVSGDDGGLGFGDNFGFGDTVEATDAL